MELTEEQVIPRWHEQYGPFSGVVRGQKPDEPMRKAFVATVHALRKHGHAAPEAGTITIPAPHGPDGILKTRPTPTACGKRPGRPATSTDPAGATSEPRWSNSFRNAADALHTPDAGQ